jgi:hypothetical protein
MHWVQDAVFEPEEYVATDVRRVLVGYSGQIAWAPLADSTQTGQTRYFVAAAAAQANVDEGSSEGTRNALLTAQRHRRQLNSAASAELRPD